MKARRYVTIVGKGGRNPVYHIARLIQRAINVEVRQRIPGEVKVFNAEGKLVKILDPLTRKEKWVAS